VGTDLKVKVCGWWEVCFVLLVTNVVLSQMINKGYDHHAVISKENEHPVLYPNSFLTLAFFHISG
jgi:hypothetical protein